MEQLRRACASSGASRRALSRYAGSLVADVHHITVPPALSRRGRPWSHHLDETCPVSTQGWMRRVHFVREGGGGGGRLLAFLRPPAPRASALARGSRPPRSARGAAPTRPRAHAARGSAAAGCSCIPRAASRRAGSCRCSSTRPPSRRSSRGSAGARAPASRTSCGAAQRCRARPPRPCRDEPSRPCAPLPGRSKTAHQGRRKLLGV